MFFAELWLNATTKLIEWKYEAKNRLILFIRLYTIELISTTTKTPFTKVNVNMKVRSYNKHSMVSTVQEDKTNFKAIFLHTAIMRIHVLICSIFCDLT